MTAPTAEECAKLRAENERLRAIVAAAEEVAKALDQVTGKLWSSVSDMEDAAHVDAALVAYRAAKDTPHD